MNSLYDKFVNCKSVLIMKMLRGAIIVWSANWSYYEKHHKPQQLEILHSYKRSIKTKTLLVMNGLATFIVNANTPGRYIGVRFVERLAEVLRDVRETFTDSQNEEDSDVTDTESECDTESETSRMIHLLPKPFKTRS